MFKGECAQSTYLTQKFPTMEVLREQRCTISHSWDEGEENAQLCLKAQRWHSLLASPIFLRPHRILGQPEGRPLTGPFPSGHYPPYPAPEGTPSSPTEIWTFSSEDLVVPTVRCAMGKEPNPL
jgi:hypothetical protein